MSDDGSSDAGALPTGAFTSYDVGRLVAALSAEIREHPSAPGAIVLNREAQLWLPWDHFHASAWEDPIWVARYKWLRIRTVGSEFGGAHVEIGSVLERLRGVLADIEASETPF